MFTYRQLSLLSYLIGSEEGLTGQFLSEALEISTKTLQTEIKSLNKVLSAKERIEHQPKQGYYIGNLTKEMRETILKAVNEAKYRSASSNRTNKILTILAFEKDYLSMEGLANRLFISKSAVRKEFDTSWRLRVFVEVSSIRGLRINTSEVEKRNMLAKVFNQDDEVLGMLNLKEDYKVLHGALNQMLIEILTEYGYILSGEALRVFNNYLLITVLRSREGFVSEISEIPIEISNLMKKIKSRIQNEFGITFDQSELICCQKKLNESSITFSGKILEQNAVTLDLSNKYEVFAKTVAVKTGIAINLEEKIKERFLLHMYKLRLRTENGTDNANFNKREINRRYPLTAHIIREYLIPVFQLKVAESEISYIILYFASLIEQKKQVIKALYISDYQPSLSYHAMEILNKRFAEVILLEHTMPQYQFLRRLPEYYEDYLIITTEPTVILQHKNTVLVKPVLSISDMNAISIQAESYGKQQEKKRLEHLLEKYMEGAKEIVVEEKMEHISEFFNAFGIEEADSAYDLVLDNQTAYFPHLYDDGNCGYQIRQYYLKHPIRYRGVEILKIVFSDYHLGEGQLQDFYQVVKRVISTV